MPFKKKPITPQPVKTEEPKVVTKVEEPKIVVTPPVVTEYKPEVINKKMMDNICSSTGVNPDLIKTAKQPEYDFATFPIQAISAQLGLPLTERIDPKSASLWKSYLADGWKPVTFSIYERENKLVVMFVR